MSFFHYLTIGRFSYDPDAPLPGLGDRVLAHFLPGGLAALQRVTGSIDPFTDDELVRIEDQLHRRFDLDVSLRSHRTDEGLLRIEYANDSHGVAVHTACIAHELCGAVAGESGRLIPIEQLRARSESIVVQKAERIRIESIQDSATRYREVVASLERSPDDPRCVQVNFGVSVLKDLGEALLPDFIVALSSDSAAVRGLAMALVEALGPAASAAAPALATSVRRPESGHEAYAAVRALAVLGDAGADGLEACLDHQLAHVRCAAAEALAKFASVSESVRARLVELAQVGDVRERSAAKRALLKLGHPW